jgi:hypothetical protein
MRLSEWHQTKFGAPGIAMAFAVVALRVHVMHPAELREARTCTAAVGDVHASQRMPV